MYKKNGSDKSFGFLLATFFFILAIHTKHQDANLQKIITLIFTSLSLCLIAFITPSWLAPLNNIWLKFGYLIGRIINPIVLGFIFFVFITPISLISRVIGRDELKLKKYNVNSYWIDRTSPSLEKDSFRKQF